MKTGTSKSDILFLALTAACAIFLFFTMRGEPAPRIMESVGDCFQVAVPLYALCLIWEREGHKEALRFALGFLIMTAAVTVLKQIIPDERPDYSPGNEKDSLPSRHTASAFFGAFAIHRRYGYKRAIIPYALSVFTGFSRVAAGRHFTHDVIVTAVALGLISWRFLKPRR